LLLLDSSDCELTYIVGVGVVYSYTMILNDSAFQAKTLTDFLLIGITLIGEFASVIKLAPDLADVSGTLLLRALRLSLPMITL
jgi:hypothetical protein